MFCRKRMHYPLEVMLTCVRWYVSYPLSFRHLEEMMEERGVVIDHATIHRWPIRATPVQVSQQYRRARSSGYQTIDCHDGEVLSAADQFYSLAF